MKSENTLNNSSSREILLIIIVIVLLAVGIVFENKFDKSPLIYLSSIVLLSAYLIGGWSVLLKAAKNIFKGNFFDENFLMSIATIGAIINK